MTHSAPAERKAASFTPIMLGFVFAWTVVVGTSLAWNVYQNNAQADELATQEAVAIFNKDQGFRLWGTRHGGVYVPVTDDTPPSPYMAHVDERDITTPSGKELTLLNPAYMVRQMMEDYSALYGIKGHITGLVLLRPENAPDDWETDALKMLKADPALEQVVDYSTIDDSPYIRMMRPMYMKPGCDKCHGQLGFKTGDFRGGVSVAVPISKYLDRRDEQNWTLIGGHGAIWLVGLFFIVGGSRNMQRSLKETQRAEAEVRTLNRELERRVKERTQELSEKSKLLHSTISNAADGIIVIDQHGVIETFNAAASRIFGYEQEEAVGQPVSILMPGNYADHHASYIDTYLKTGRANIIGSGRELEGQRKDGSVFPLYIALSKIELDGRILFSGICRDLTREKVAEQELTEAKLQAERANNAKSEFLASMSHELRTPLNGIIGFSQLLQHDPKEPLSENQTTYTGLISEAGEHLLSLINDILDLSRIETEGFSMSIETIDPVSAMDNCLTLIVPVAEKHKVDIRGAFDRDALPMIVADEVRFKQVLMNLLSNAAKYNHEGGYVSLTAQVLGETVRFSITDDGPGIPEDRLHALFEPFNRLGQEAGTVEGTGIGLTITKRLVERMNGALGVDSTPGEGSTFWFELPISSEAEAHQSSITNGVDLSVTAPEGDFRILYIEDNLHNQMLMGELLKPYKNMEYLTASNGEDGLAQANDLHPDLILMDIDLPGMDGFEVHECLMKNAATADIPVIAVSANALPRDIRAADSAGFVHYLTKPLDVIKTQKTIFQTLRDTTKKA